MDNETLRKLLKKHSISGLKLANHFKIPRQQVYAWLHDRNKIGRAWSILLTQYFDNIGK